MPARQRHRRPDTIGVALLAAVVFTGCATTDARSGPVAVAPVTVAPATVAPATVAPAAVEAVGDTTTVDGSAMATLPAVRVDPPYTACQRIARAAADGSTTTQVVVRTTAWSDSTATVELATLEQGTWVCSDPMPARVGRNGVRVLIDRRSGDGTTPAGVFPLATMTAPDGQRFSFFGNAPDPGVTAGTYRAVQPGDCFGATPGTSGYGHLRNDPACSGADDEYLPRFTTTYSNAALIGANMEPEVSGDAPGEVPYAAAIFLHRHTYVSGSSGATKPTAGCVSLAQADLTAVLVGLAPGALFVIGPTDWLLTSLG